MVQTSFFASPGHSYLQKRHVGHRSERFCCVVSIINLGEFLMEIYLSICHHIWWFLWSNSICLQVEIVIEPMPSRVPVLLVLLKTESCQCVCSCSIILTLAEGILDVVCEIKLLIMVLRSLCNMIVPWVLVRFKAHNFSRDQLSTYSY